MQMRPIRTAPRNGELIWLYSDAEWVGARLGYWHACSRTKWWASPYQGWINGATQWLPVQLTHRNVRDKPERNGKNRNENG